MAMAAKTLRMSIYMVIIALLYPLIIPVTLLAIIIQKLSQFCVKKWHSDGQEILGTLKPFSHIAVNDFFKPIPRLNIVVTGIVEGYLPMDTFLQTVTTNLVERRIKLDGKNESETKLKFPELQCQIVKIGGYCYWKKIQDFQVKHYVSPCYDEHENVNENKVTTKSDLNRVIARLSSKPWEGNKSPWEFILINNYVEDGHHQENTEINVDSTKSVVILRVHHLLADGYSIINLLGQLGAGEFKISAEPKVNLKRTFTQSSSLVLAKFLRQLMIPFMLVYPMAVTFEEFTQRKHSTWKVIPGAQKLKPLLGKQNSQLKYNEWSVPIPLATLKEIKNKFGVSFQAVLNTVFAGAIRNLMEISKQEVPEEFTTFLPIPLPGHPGGLTVHVGYILMKLPVGERDTLKRLSSTTKELKGLSKTPLPLLMHTLYAYMGIYPYFVTRLIGSIDVGYTAMFSPFPCFDGLYSVANHQMTTILFTLGSGCDGAGATITTLSSFDKISFGITIDTRVYPSEENMAKFSYFIHAEIKNLLEIEPVNK